MQTGEVIPKHWKYFCQRVSETHKGALVQIQLAEADGGLRAVAGELPLQSFAFDDERNGYNDEIVIETGLPNERPLQHRIIGPVRVILRNGGNGNRYNQLQILAENGTTIMTFHPGISPELLSQEER